MHDDRATLLLNAGDIERLLPPPACIAAIEHAFRRLGERSVPAPGILGMHAADGGFHLKAAFLETDRPYFAAKLNANFPYNAARHGLPTIQGVLVLCDASNGAPLAIMDSISITALRTAAASAIAARHLAPPDCGSALICGCGAQAAAHLRALLHVRKPDRVFAYDQDPAKAAAFARKFADSEAVRIEPAHDLAAAARACDLVITCTTATRYFLTREMIRPGTFVAAVGADSERKQEIEPRLMAEATVVTDLTDQACAIGDLHHAIAAGAMNRAQMHAELGEIVAGSKRARGSADEIIVFDSTGTGLQDVAAAIAAYRGAREQGAGRRFSLAGSV
jgi:ornithine cyclodeaminase/alanine dehydrogenase-like protein (mu-crystallin family)